MKKNLSVVIAENDVKASRTIARSLGVHKNWVLHIALDDADVFEAALGKELDAIVIESLFPGRALNIIHRLQSSANTAHIPILAITGKVGPQCAELTMTGARKCMVQPVGGRAMTKVLREIAEDKSPTMHPPKQYVDDLERISVLEQTSMLDTEPVAQFDLITRLTTKILGVPVALVSLIDNDRQFFKSQIGLPEPWATARETPLSHSFCQWVVSGNEPLVVSDAREHNVLANNLAVRDLGVIAYAGQPIRVREEYVIGSFCAIDGHPRTWTFDELIILRDFTDLTEAFIDLDPALLDPSASDRRFEALNDAEKLVAMQSAAKGIAAVTRLVQKSDLPLDTADRKALMREVELFSDLQTRLSNQ